MDHIMNSNIEIIEMDINNNSNYNQLFLEDKENAPLFLENVPEAFQTTLFWLEISASKKKEKNKRKDIVRNIFQKVANIS